MIGSGKFWVGIAVSVLMLALFAFTIDVGQMVEALRGANYAFLAPGIGLYLVSVLFRTIRWRVLLGHLRPISVARLYPVVVVGYMANNLLPMRLGEIVRSYYVGEREGISRASALVTILVERVLDALTLLFFIAFISLFVPLSEFTEAFGQQFGIARTLLVVLVTLPFLVAFAGLLLIAFCPLKARVAALLLTRRLPERLELQANALTDMLLDGLVPLRNPRALALLFLISVPIWLFESAMFFLLGFSFGLDRVYETLASMAVAMVLVTAIANLVSSIPAAPGGLGLFELAARETLVLLPLAAVDRSVAAGFVAVVHAALLLPMIMMGQAFLWAGHISLRRLSQAGKQQQGPLGVKGEPAVGPMPPKPPAQGEESQ